MNCRMPPLVMLANSHLLTSIKVTSRGRCARTHTEVIVETLDEGARVLLVVDDHLVTVSTCAARTPVNRGRSQLDSAAAGETTDRIVWL